MILPVPWSRAVRRSSRSVWEIRTRCRNWELRWRKKTARRPTKKRWRLCWRSSTGPGAVQVMRVLNFYSFNNVNNTIDSLYYCGGGARYGELIDALKETLDLPVRSVAELLPEVSLDEEDEWIDSPQAYGVLLA